MTSYHFSDANGNPSGGQTFGRGFAISWQNGPLAVDGVRKEPNGAFVEQVIEAAVDRINFYQRSKFASPYNEAALKHLMAALEMLKTRTLDREARGVEGTHTL